MAEKSDKGRVDVDVTTEDTRDLSEEIRKRKMDAAAEDTHNLSEERKRIVNAIREGKTEWHPDAKECFERGIKLNAPDFTVVEAYLESCWGPHERNRGGFTVRWATESAGFGEMVMVINNEGKLECDNETMGPEFLKAVLCKLVDGAELRS